jgi:hypothetical protein
MPDGNTLQLKDVLVGVKGKLVATSFRGFDYHPQHLFIVRIEWLEADWICKTGFPAHLASVCQEQVNEFNAR